MTTADLLFVFLGLIAGASGLLAVSTRRVVHSALWLTLSMAALSGCFLVLGAELVALVQLLVYVGAIVVLVLFAMMLTRSPIGSRRDNSVSLPARLSAAVISAATGGLLFVAFFTAFGTRAVKVASADTNVLALNLFGRYSWPFEVLSMVLLAALVGALALLAMSHTRVSRADGDTEDDADVTAELGVKKK